MELFTAAGIELPPSGKGGRGKRPALRSLRVPLFNYKVVQRARELMAFAPSAEQMKAAQDYARKIKNPKFLKQKETAVRPLFIQDILQTVLGYSPFDPAEPYTLKHEEQIRAGAVDVAIGNFNKDNGADAIVAPFELKGPGTDDLDRVMPGRGRSPVQQAWDYAVDAPGSRWVLVSNCIEIRLYGFGRGRDAYELFDLTRLDEAEEHARLLLILSAARFLGGQTDQLLRDTDSAYKDITNDLYRQYKELRERLIGFLTGSVDGPKLAALQAIEIAQKVLDRILFIAFAQRTDLLPDKLLEEASTAQNRFDPQPIWINFRNLFRAVDTGSDRLQISPYNGGLFAEDAIADSLILPDPLATDVAQLGQWDYKREVPVTVLGHIFEQSITDIEKLKAESIGESPPAISKRKREGVVYTPDMVTRFLVERTIGLTLNERRAVLWETHGMREGEAVEPAREIAFWQAYLSTLCGFTIVDPACGSGAFLVAAFDEMARRYREAVSGLAALDVEITFDIFDEIVTKNLHGVDVNAESVEITRLALWLKTARRDHRLQNLEATIKCGNSLIDDPKFTDRPFDWHAAFPEVFARGGFDVVIGNPPYVRSNTISNLKPYLRNKFDVFDSAADLYCFFYELSFKLAKPASRVGYISSSSFLKTTFGQRIRNYLSDRAYLECGIDFLDTRIFESVTTYPIILVFKTISASREYEIPFLFKNVEPNSDVGQIFKVESFSYPSARLRRKRWHFESEATWQLRDKIETGAVNNLGQILSPVSGIKTGLTEAFVLSGETAISVISAASNSADLLRPWLTGDDLSRWHSENLSSKLIFIPKGWTRDC